MIRLNFALHRLANLSRAEFQRYWRDTHGPVVVSVSRALRMRRDVQSHSVEDPLYDGLRAARAGMHAPFDGIASVWFDSREDLVAASPNDIPQWAADAHRGLPEGLHRVLAKQTVG